MSEAAAVPSQPVPDKREAILDAALRVIARLGLHAAPVSVVAREAGVAAGTLYLYFPGKEAMINALYLELVEDRRRAMSADGVPEGARDALRHIWYGLARWHLDRPDASSVLHQCEASAILTEETREARRRMDAAGAAQFADAVAHGVLRPLPREVFWALLVGPIVMLARMADTGELAVTDEVLRETFDGVCRSVLPNA